MTKSVPFSCRAAIIALAMSMPVTAAGAQAVVQPLTTPNADRLAEQMKVLAKDPDNVAALIAAGEASVKLDEPNAALQFFQRAESAGGKSPRITAGRAAALVALERPGEALILFREAEAAGFPVETMASDRGLAYDLLGYPRYAQRDYRLALTQGRDPLIERRLALSLGISGDVKAADDVLAPLFQENDRAAWRARAFVLAMNGDLAQANQIARAMVPGSAAALSPFFERLAQMSPADRAFAVHFGQLGRTPAQVADGSLITPMPALMGDAPVRMASTDGRKPPKTRKSRRTSRSDQQVALANPEPVPLPASQVTPAPSYTPTPTPSTPPAAPSITADPLPAPARTLPRQRPVQTAFVLRSGWPAPMVATPVPRTVERVALAPSDVPGSNVMSASASVDPKSLPAVAPPPVARAPEGAAPAPSAGSDDEAVRQRNVQALGAIVAGLSPDTAAPVAAPPAATATSDSTATAPKSDADDKVRFVRKAFVPGPIKPVPKSLAARPVAPAEADSPVKKAPEPKAKPKVDREAAEPSRHWVQVAGGANEKALPFTWKRLIKQAPDAFKGQNAWTTPLNATNRLLAGPFKSDDAAQDFVNQLSAKGIQAFTFTSTAGQKIKKLQIK